MTLLLWTHLTTSNWIPISSLFPPSTFLMSSSSLFNLKLCFIKPCLICKIRFHFNHHSITFLKRITITFHYNQFLVVMADANVCPQRHMLSDIFGFVTHTNAQF